MKPIWIALMALVLAHGADKTQDAERQLKAAMNTELVDGNLKAAIEQYKKVAQSGVRPLAAQALIHMAECYQKLGDAESRRVYERVVKDYADQKEAVTTARTRLGGTHMVAGAGISSRRLWTLPRGASIEGTASRDGRYIPYIDWDHYGDLYVHDLVTGADRRITNTGTDGKPGVVDEFAEEYTFSRDGNQLVYSWFRGDHDRYELRVVDLKGNGVPQFRLLFDNQDIEWISPDDWSSDGKWLAVQLQRKDKTSQIGVVSVQDGSLRVLKSMNWRGSSKISFSPDGKYLGYDRPESDDSRQSDVFVIAVDGSHEIPAVVHRGQDVMTGWSPDGKQLLFASDRNGSMSLWALPFVDRKPQGAPELIKADIGRFDSMGVTPSGALYSSVYQAGPRSSVQVADFDFATGKLSSPSDVTEEYLESNSWPSWSPDGKYLAYLSERGRTGSGNTANLVVVIRSAETRQVVRELRVKLNNFNVVGWAPDGRSFLAQGRDFKGRQGIYQVDAQTGDVSPLILSQPTGSSVANPAWSPDGKSLYFSRRLSGGKEFVFVQRDLASGNEKEIIRRTFLGGVILSPDGRYIATPSVDPSTNSRIMLLIPTAGGGPREVMRAASEVEPGDLTNYSKGQGIGGGKWAPDSRSFLVRKRFADEKQNDELWRIPVDGVPSKLDARLDRNVRGHNVHPDGRQMIYATAEPGPRPPGEVWVLENFLPATNTKK